MSINAYVGLPRSGKSYNVVKHVIIPALKAGRLVVHNMMLDHDALLSEYPQGRLEKLPEGCTAEQLVLLCPPGAVIVLDEIWRYWPAGLTAAKVPPDQQEFFTMHGHKVGEDGRTQEIALVTQDLSQIAAWIRVLVEQTFRHTKLTSVGQDKKFRVDIYGGCVTGQAPPASKLLKQEFGTYEESVWRFYKSHTMSQTGEAGVEQRADRRGNILAGWRIKAAIAALCLVPFMLWGVGCSIARFKDKVTGADKQDTPVPVTDGESADPTAPPAPPPPQTPQYSSLWRYAGEIVVDGVQRAVFESDRGPRIMPWAICEKDAGSNVVCHYDGQIVAEWTGPSPPISTRLGLSSSE